MSIDDFIGRLSVDDMPELLEAAWSAATSEQQAAFAVAHEAELLELLGVDE